MTFGNILINDCMVTFSPTGDENVLYEFAKCDIGDLVTSILDDIRGEGKETESNETESNEMKSNETKSNETKTTDDKSLEKDLKRIQEANELLDVAIQIKMVESKSLLKLICSCLIYRQYSLIL